MTETTIQRRPYGLNDGDLYVYKGEGEDAIAVAMNGRGSNGGWMGISIARMSTPDKHKTQEDLNHFAALFARSPVMQAEIESLTAEKAELVEALKPFAAITRSSFYSGDEDEAYSAVLWDALQERHRDFTGQDIYRARAILARMGESKDNG